MPERRHRGIEGGAGQEWAEVIAMIALSAIAAATGNGLWLIPVAGLVFDFFRSK